MKETADEPDDANKMKELGHESDISDDMTEPSQEQAESSMTGAVLQSAGGSEDTEKPHQHAVEDSDGSSMKNVGIDQEQSQASDFADDSMNEPSQEVEIEEKNKQEEAEPSQEMSIDSQSQSVIMDSQELLSPNPLADEPIESNSESQVMEQSNDTCKPAQSDIQDGDMADERDGDEK